MEKLLMIFLKFKDSQISINVFHTRGSFLWIGASSSTSNLSTKWFNDVPRGMQMFRLKIVEDSKGNEINIPEDIDKYFFDYEHSKFIECNNELAKNISKLQNGKFEQNNELNGKIMPCLNELVQKLENMKKKYWLTSGTLLGWYRQCGIIPFTVNCNFLLIKSNSLIQYI